LLTTLCTSSIEQIDMVDRQNLMPAASAARAASISPSPWTRPVSPVGAMASGIETASPSIEEASDTFDTSDQHTLAQADGVEFVAVGIERELIVGATLHVIVDRARDSSPRDPP
jgi:hypothetical protein